MFIITFKRHLRSTSHQINLLQRLVERSYATKLDLFKIFVLSNSMTSSYLVSTKLIKCAEFWNTQNTAEAIIEYFKTKPIECI